jgi:hypothetical protein
MAQETTTHEYYPVTPRFPEGTSTDDGLNRRVFVRQEIDEWSGKRSNKKQVDLFIMAMDKLQKKDPKERLSYFQVAGMVSLLKQHRSIINH